MSEKWEWGNNFGERFGKAMTTGFRSDLQIILLDQGQKTEINVHKIFLQMGSLVFDRQIQKIGFTNGQGKVSQLTILNIDPDIFKMMIKHFYTGDSGAKMSHALRLLKLAKEYEVSELVTECYTLLNGEITEENALPLFEEGMFFANKQIIERTLKFICSKGTTVLKRKEFAYLRLGCLIEIIKQDDLKVDSEMEVFEAVYRWGEAICRMESLDANNPPVMRKVLDKALKYVRFPLMKSEEFVLKVGTKNLLGMEEQMALLMCFLVPPDQRSVLPEGRFISSPRINGPSIKSPVVPVLSTPKSYVVSREIGNTLSFDPCSTNSETLRLSSTIPFILEGLKFHKNNFDLKVINEWTLYLPAGTANTFLHEYIDASVNVTRKSSGHSQAINLNCSFASDENYFVANFEKAHQISVNPPDFIDITVSINFKTKRNMMSTGKTNLHWAKFLKCAKGYGPNTRSLYNKLNQIILINGNAKFTLENPQSQNQLLNQGLIHSFIVSF